MTVQYVANDGTVFGSEAECIDYESAEELIMLDEYYNRTYQPIEAYYVLITNQAEKEFFTKSRDRYQCRNVGLKDYGLYVLDEFRDEWMLIDELIQAKQDEITDLKNDITDLENNKRKIEQLQGEA